MKRAIRNFLAVSFATFLVCPLFLANGIGAAHAADDGPSIAARINAKSLEEASQKQKSVELLALEQEFSWSNAYLIPGATAYVSSTDTVFYQIMLNNAAVGDKFVWDTYNPVIDPETYMPTGGLAYYDRGTETRTTEEYWDFTTGFSVERYYYPSGTGEFGVGPVIKDFGRATQYPGVWQITISRNGVPLTTTTFTLVDDLAPKVSFVSPTDGKIIKDRAGVQISASDNLKVMKLELYVDNVNTGQSTLLTSFDKPAASVTYTWEAQGYEDGEYVLRAKAIDPYDNIGTDSVTVNLGNKASAMQQLPTDKSTTVGEPINVASGNMSMAETDIRIPFKEIPLELSRAYNSQDDLNGMFGYGWRSNFDVVLREQPDQSVVETDENGVYTIYTRLTDGTYTPSLGKYSVLIKYPDNTFTILRKHGRKLYFNAVGNLIKIEERNGNHLSITRAANGVLSQVSDSAGRRLLFTVDALGKITQVSDPAGRIFKYQYDTFGNLIKTIDPLSKSTNYQYDAQHNLTVKTDPNSHSLYFEYDASDRANHSWQDVGNNVVTLAYDWANKTTSVVDSLGNTTRYEYNRYGLVTKTTDARGYDETVVWDANFNKISNTDKNGQTTDFIYDSRGNLLRVTDPLANVTAFTYEPTFDFVKTATDALSKTTTYVYDSKGNLVGVTDALGNTITHAYDSSGQRIQTKDANNNAINFAYDTFGNLLRVTDALSYQKTFTYNALGNVLKATDQRGNTTTFTYDLLSRLTQTTYADTSKTSSTYDAVGNLLSFTDQARRVTTYTYDVVNRPLTKTDALASVLTNTYDTEGRLIAVTDPKLQKTQYVYDSVGNLITTTDPLGNQTLASYDGNGNRISQTDAKNYTTTYEYDADNRLIRTTYPDSTSALFVYDPLARKTAMTDSTGKTRYAYDALGRLTQVDGPQASDTVSYSYDPVGNRIQMTNPNSGITVYAYDALNRVKTLTDPQAQATNYTYDPAGNLIATTYPNGTQVTNTYDTVNRLTSLVNKKGSTIISSYAYTYDTVGMRTKVTLNNGDYITYTYDKLNRLLSENRYNLSKKVLYSIVYTYDSVGNRLTQKNTVNDANYKISDYPLVSTLAYSYNAANQLNNLKVQVVNKNKITVVKESNYTYDANGNLVQQNSNQIITNFNYDYEDRLVLVSTGATVSASYVYDAEGKRISRNEGGTVTQFTCDGMNVILETNSAGQKVASYTHGLGYPGGIGGLIASYNAAGASIHYLYDGSGSVTGLANLQGVVQASYTYDAFGNLLQQSGTAANTYKFQTKQTSTTTGLVYFGARYYNSLLGRFITQDPLGMIDGPNMYAYVNNNPVNLMDPWGLCKKTGWWPKWLDIFVPGYREYGGPMRNGPGKPEDLMDEGFAWHDGGYFAGHLLQADIKLLRDLFNLPPNPFNWGKGVNPVYGSLYRSTAFVVFAIRVGIVETMETLKDAGANVVKLGKSAVTPTVVGGNAGILTGRYFDLIYNQKE